MTERAKPPALVPAAVPAQVGSSYPKPFDEPCSTRERRVLGDPLGLTQFGVNLLVLPPGAWSSQRHWHLEEDEFVYILEGEVVLVTDAGEQVLKPGMAAGFPAGKRDGHHLVNRGTRTARLIEVGTRSAAEHTEYSDIDMKGRVVEGAFRYFHKDGEPY
jgi:uncharacterized cupin superfamily protein